MQYQVRNNWLTTQSGANPSLGANSLLTGKLTGNFEKIGLSGEESSVKQTQNQ
jgi:hypothetical protein